MLRVGVQIPLIAEAFDSDGAIQSVEFSVNDQPLSVASPLSRAVFQQTWTPLLPGNYAITAKATDSDGAVSVSNPVRVTVIDAPIVVTRYLPKVYRPGGKFRVRLAVEPGSEVKLYAVEDTPPGGWIVTRITHGGTYDAVTGLVKFGPFTDNKKRVLGYDVSVPQNATGTQRFAGRAFADDVPQTIVGQQAIEMQTKKSGREVIGLAAEQQSLSPK
jgi:hypothetical protein